MSENESNNQSQITEIIFEALSDLNEERGKGKHIEVALETPLLGKKAELDSLEFLNFVLNVEGKLTDKLKIEVSLSDGTALSSGEHPFSSVENLSKFIRSAQSE